MTYATWLLERVALQVKNAGHKPTQFALEDTATDHSDSKFRDIRDGFIRVGAWALQNPSPLFEAIVKKEPFDVVVGMRPYSRFHIGHLTLMRELQWLIGLGGRPVFMYAAHEAGVFLSAEYAVLEKSRFDKAYTGFTGTSLPVNTESISDRDSDELRSIEERVAPSLTVRKVLQLYGWDESTSLSKLRVPSIMASTFLLLATRNLGRPVLVLSDINQVTHAEATKIAAKHLELPFPSFSYRTLLQSLQGPDYRMSTKDPRSVIFLDEDREEVATKLQKSFSGGCTTPEEQKLHGGDPHRCSFFKVAEVVQPRLQTETMYQDCVTGSTLCGQCKKNYRTKVADCIAKRAIP